jgi:hypothetical protein
MKVLSPTSNLYYIFVSVFVFPASISASHVVEEQPLSGAKQASAAYLKDLLFASPNTEGLQSELAENLAESLAFAIPQPNCEQAARQRDVFQILGNSLNERIKNGGQQPLLEVLMYESMAFSENPRVTSWYMQMFGGSDIPEENKMFHGITPLIFTDGVSDAKKRKFFWSAFRNIASNPVGRNLLYRLLIETRRQDGIENKIAQMYSKSGFVTSFKDLRKKALALRVKWTVNDFSINPFKGLLCFNERLCKIQYCNDAGRRDLYNISVGPSNINVDLFHELLHWFHALRNPIRYFDEKFGFELPIEDLIRQHPFCSFLWGISRDTPQRDLLGAIRTWNEHSNEGYFDLEEVRTIIGFAPQNSSFTDSWHNVIATFEPGDELSENLYRRSVGLPFRFGHSCVSTIEKRSTVERCFAWVNAFIDQVKIPITIQRSPSLAERIAGGVKSYSTRIFEAAKMLCNRFIGFFTGSEVWYSEACDEEEEANDWEEAGDEVCGDGLEYDEEEYEEQERA